MAPGGAYWAGSALGAPLRRGSAAAAGGGGGALCGALALRTSKSHSAGNWT
jgi:hypothetical protein